jgi:lysylphosphatidylglycerol synthetase-like protein (DUF2156 family)
LYLVSSLQWTALFFTFSRSAWFAAIVWILVSSVFGLRTSVKWIAYRLSLIAMLTALFFPLVQSRLAGETVPELRSRTERISGYSEAIALWRTHPLVGIGVGNYTIWERAAFPNRAPWEYQPAHNVPLLFLAELGVIGVLLALWILADGFRILTPQHAMLIALLPLLLLDHYLWSSYVGLLLFSLFFIPSPSTGHPQSAKGGLDAASRR